MGPMLGKKPLSDAEWTIMKALWSFSPASVRLVFESLRGETGWAYSTVKTMLTRLVGKGILSVETRGNTGWYSPLLSASEARRSALRGLVDRAFGGTFSSMVQHLVVDQELSLKEREEMEEVIRRELGRPLEKNDS